MRTSGFHIGNVLLFLSLTAAIPASAQQNSIFQRYTISSPDKEVAIYRNSYAETDRINDPSFRILTTSANNGNSAPFVIDEPKPVVKKILFAPSVDKKKVEDPEITFSPTTFTYPKKSRGDVGIAEYPVELLLLYAESLKQYAIKNGFDTSYAFLSNMGMLCNKKRFYVVNLATMKVEQTGLVSHGRGQGETIYDKQYSNEPGSRSTSLGRYKILGKYKGNYGEAYKMDGLDSTNRNALNRNIVLHAMGCIPDRENMFPACVSDGCPAVSSKFLSTLQQIIDSRKKPMLLWIFDSNLEEPDNYDLGEDATPITPGLFSTTKNNFSLKQYHRDDRLHEATTRVAKRNNLKELLKKGKTAFKSIKDKLKITDEDAQAEADDPSFLLIFGHENFNTTNF